MVIPDSPEEHSVYLRVWGYTDGPGQQQESFMWRTHSPIEEFTRIDIPLTGEGITEITLYIDGGAAGNALDGDCLDRSSAWIDALYVNPGITATSESRQNVLSVFPNPASDIIFINSPLGENPVYTLYSMLGERIASGPIINSQIQVREKGLFILKVAWQQHSTLTSRSTLLQMLD